MVYFWRSQGGALAPSRPPLALPLVMDNIKPYIRSKTQRLSYCITMHMQQCFSTKVNKRNYERSFVRILAKQNKLEQKTSAKQSKRFFLGESISYRKPYRFGQENDIFWYWSILAQRFEIIANFIIITIKKIIIISIKSIQYLKKS